MGWSANFAEGVRGNALDEDLDPAKATCSPPGIDTWADAPREQFAAARSAAYDMIEKGVVGSADKTYSVMLSGHANPDHEAAAGWANDMATVSVSQRS